MKEILTKYKHNFSLYSSYTMVFGFICILILILGYVFPLSYILTIPFIFIPFLYGYQVSIAEVNTTRKVSLKSMFVAFRLYFSPRSFGSYSVLKGFLKGLIAFIVCYFVCIIILYYTYMIKDSSLMELMDKIRNVKSLNEYYSLLNEISNNQTFINVSSISFLVASFPALMLFLHNTFMYSIKALFSVNSASPVVFMKGISSMFKVAFPSIRKKYLKDYYSVIWINIIIFILGYVIGAFLGYFVIKNARASQVSTIALASAFVLSLLFIPIIFNLIESLFLKYRIALSDGAIKTLIDNLESALKDKKINEEERKSFENLLNQIKKEDKQSSKEDSDKKE